LHLIEDKELNSSSFSVTFSPDGKCLVVGTASHAVIFVYRLTSVTAAVPVEAGERYTNAKVVLVGESGVGKSGLALRLIDDKFINTPSTHGMNVWRLDLPIEEKKGMEREALLWDLAGQEDYRLIHQLYLDENAPAAAGTQKCRAGHERGKIGAAEVPGVGPTVETQTSQRGLRRR
jgi:hypothetical protein